jgi:hypothetical protein
MRSSGVLATLVLVAAMTAGCSAPVPPPAEPPACIALVSTEQTATPDDGIPRFLVTLRWPSAYRDVYPYGRAVLYSFSLRTAQIDNFNGFDFDPVDPTISRTTVPYFEPIRLYVHIEHPTLPPIELCQEVRFLSAGIQ